MDKNAPPELVDVPAHKDDVLANVIKKRCPEMKIHDQLFWAKIRDYADSKSINPFLLPCGLIKEGEEVEYENRKGKIYHNKMQLDSKLSNSSCKLFFISMCNRKNKAAITYVHHEKLGRNTDICVVAHHGETFREALSRDGRFKNVNRFRLKRKVAGEKAVVYIDDIVEEMVLQVAVKTTEQPNDTKPNCTPIASESASTSGGATVLGQQKATTDGYNELGKQSWKRIVSFFDHCVCNLSFLSLSFFFVSS